MNKLTRTLLAIVALAVAPLALAADLSGKWTASFETPIGTQNYNYEFQQKGTALTGSIKSNLLGEAKVESGKVDGNKVTFVEKASYQGMDLVITYNGEIAGDEIHFKREVGGFGTEELVAKRAK
ncbi:MAG TPA: hypothetical protein VMH83_09420 [Candidatus Acidoferrum sp.]|nr:hypothetical protein [Candidatus Acidoferrum sp.]